MTTTSLNSPKDYAYYYLDKMDVSIFICKSSPASERKQPAVASTDIYYTRKPTHTEIDDWFKEDPYYNLAIALGPVSHAIAFDVDSQAAVDRIRSVIPKMSSTLQQAFANTMKNRTGSGGEHIVFKVEGDITGLKRHQIWTDGKPHSQILLLAYKSYIIAAPSVHDTTARRYEWNHKDPITITRQELDEFIRLVRSENQRDQYVPNERNIYESGSLRSLSIEEMRDLLGWIKPYYYPGNRDNIIFYLSGMMHKANISQDSARRFIKLLCNASEYEDEDLDKSLTVVDNTYLKSLDELNGKSGLRNLLITSFESSDDDYNDTEYLKRTDAYSQICQIINERPPQPHLQPQQKQQQAEQQQKKGETDAETKVRGLTETLERRYHFAAMDDTNELFYYNEEKGLYEPAAGLVKSEIENQYPGALTGTVVNVIEKLTRRHQVKRDAFDADLLTWNMENGLYDIRTKTLRPHTWKYLSRKRIPITFNPNIRPKKWGKFLSEVLYPNQIRTAVDAMAYTFLRDNPFELYFILLGFGSNGKSVLMHILTMLHGEDNVSNTSLARLLSDRFAKKDLEGKNVNLDMEMSKATIDDMSVLKELTGSQPIRVEPKYMQAYTTRLWAKHFFSTNEMPEMKDNTDAHYRREVIISFPNQFVEGENANPNLKHELTTPEELSGIFNALMIPLRRIAMEHKAPYMDAKTIQQRKLKHQLVSDPVKTFLEIATEPTEYESDPNLPKEDLYEGYKQFCAFYRLPWQKYNDFCGNVKKKGINDYRETSGDRKRVWTGIRLKRSMFEDPLTV